MADKTVHIESTATDPITEKKEIIVIQNGIEVVLKDICPLIFSFVVDDQPILLDKDYMREMVILKQLRLSINNQIAREALDKFSAMIIQENFRNSENSNHEYLKIDGSLPYITNIDILNELKKSIKANKLNKYFAI